MRIYQHEKIKNEEGSDTECKQWDIKPSPKCETPHWLFGWNKTATQKNYQKTKVVKLVLCTPHHSSYCSIHYRLDSGVETLFSLFGFNMVIHFFIVSFSWCALDDSLGMATIVFKQTISHTRLTTRLRFMLFLLFNCCIISSFDVLNQLDHSFSLNY